MIIIRNKKCLAGFFSPDILFEKQGGYMMYHRLENSIIDVIKEEQAKLGYRKEEIRLYYPLSSLDHFFETSADAEEMKKILAGFGAYTKEKTR